MVVLDDGIPLGGYLLEDGFFDFLEAPDLVDVVGQVLVSVS